MPPIFRASALSRAGQYARLKHLSSLLEAKIKFVVHGSDAMTIVHRAPAYHGFSRPVSQHVLVPKSSVGLAARILSQQHGYDIFNNPPFPHLCTQILAFRPSTALPDGNSTTVVLTHPDPEYDGAAWVFLHPSSTFHFDLDDPSRTLTNPNPPDHFGRKENGGEGGAFVDSAIDSHFAPPACEEEAYQPYFDWLSQMRDSAFCEYPNEWEYFDTLEDDEPYEDPVWREGKRPWGDGYIPALEYIVRMIKEENRPFATRVLQEKESMMISLAMRSEIKARRINKLKSDDDATSSRRAEYA